MTIGISKVYLEGKLLQAKKYNDINLIELLKYLITECADLDPWLPIDENTPRDAPVVVKFEDDSCEVAILAEYGWRSNDGLDFAYGFDIPTHYKILPEDPKG